MTPGKTSEMVVAVVLLLPAESYPRTQPTCVQWCRISCHVSFRLNAGCPLHRLKHPAHIPTLLAGAAATWNHLSTETWQETVFAYHPPPPAPPNRDPTRFTCNPTRMAIPIGALLKCRPKRSLNGLIDNRPTGDPTRLTFLPNRPTQRGWPFDPTVTLGG